MLRAAIVATLVSAVVGGSVSAAPPSAPLVTARQPSWSPDGTELAFVGTTAADRRGIFVSRIAGGEPAQVTSGDDAQPVWTHDGRSIVFAEVYEPQPHYGYEVRVVAPSTGGERSVALIGPAPNRISISADDALLAYTETDGVDFVLVREGRAYHVRQSLTDAVFSPTRPRRLAVSWYRDQARQSQLFTMNADGRGARRLGRTYGDEQPLAWSQDGKRILSRRFGDWIYVMTAAGRHQRRLATNATRADFAPSGRRIVYARGGGGISVVRTDGRGRNRLTADGRDPHWSPDGAWIAFTTGGAVELIRPDGRGRRILAGAR